MIQRTSGQRAEGHAGLVEAFCLEVSYDKLERRIEISATVSEAVAEAFHNAEDLPEEVQGVAQRANSGGGIRTRDLRVMSPTSYLTAPPRGALENVAPRTRSSTGARGAARAPR